MSDCRPELRRGAYDAGTPQVKKKALLLALTKLPISTLYVAKEPNRWPRRFAEGGETPTVPKIPVLRLTTFVDNAPVTSTHQLRPNTLHTLRFQVKGAEWPKHAQRLRIELLSTCPPSLFHVSTFETADRSGAPEFEAAVIGNIQLSASQSDGALDVTVIGYCASVRNANGTSLRPKTRSWAKWVATHLLHYDGFSLKLVPFVRNAEAANSDQSGTRTHSEQTLGPAR